MSVKVFTRILLFPAFFGLMASLDVEAGGDNQAIHGNHHEDHGGHMSMGDSYPSTMFMGKTTFVLGGVDGVTDSGMGGMNTSNEKDGTVFNYDTKLMFMTSFTGQDMLKTAVRIGNFGMMEPFGMMGEARLDRLSVVVIRWNFIRLIFSSLLEMAFK